MSQNEQYMKRALELAQMGADSVAPNPLVGCVIVHNNQIVGEGFHRQYGGPHAEPNAIRSVSNPSILKDSTLYVTLEPCSHHGKTPPCSDLIIEKGIKKVVICNRDPFNLVNGKGIEKLRKAGISVTTGVLEQEGNWVNRRFFVAQTKKRPYIILKWAQTQDGFIDDLGTQPLKISTHENAALVHQWRSQEDAILVGGITVLKDNPSLTSRHVSGRNPIRIILDFGKHFIPQEANIFNKHAETVVFTNKEYKEVEGVDFITLDSLDLKEVLNNLAERNIQSLIVEGGRKTLQTFIDLKLWDEARITTASFNIDNGVKKPLIDGELKESFNTGKACTVSVLSPRVHSE